MHLYIGCVLGRTSSIVPIRPAQGMLLQWILVYLTAVCLLLDPCEAVDVGFDLLFQTDLTELQNYPVRFHRPVPGWMRGELIRNGLGRFELGDRHFAHIFDAYAKLSSWKFVGNGSVFFTTRFVRSDSYSESLRKKTVAPYLLFGAVEPPFTWTESLRALLHGIDNTNINVFQFGNNSKDLVALGDFWHEYLLEQSTLITLGRVAPSIPGASSWSKELPLPNPSSSHPVKEFGTNNYINFVLTIHPGFLFSSTLHLVRIKSVGERELITSLKLKRIPYMHSFALSKNYAVIFANPLFVDILKMVKTAQPGQSLDWNPDIPTDMYVINIHTGEVKTLYTEAAYVMHHINTFEKDPGRIYIDAVVYPDLGFVTSLTQANLQDPMMRSNVKVECKIKRYIVDLTKGTVLVSEFPVHRGEEFINRLDLPIINELYRQEPYCFVYGLVVKSDNVHLSNETLVKKDVCGKGRDKSWYKANHYPSEPWFLAYPRGTKEDDGYLLSTVLDGEKGRSYLGIWDAATMRLVNKGSIPTAIPFGLHGRFFQ